MHLSIIIPTLNETSVIVAALQSLQALRNGGVEIIVADGGSSDDTASQAAMLADGVVKSKQGRAIQMNAGARKATGYRLLFLHADTRLPNNLDELIAQWEKNQVAWGFFPVRLSGSNPIFRIIAFFINLRSRLTQVATGDQCLFVEKSLFVKLGGFPEIPLMEDVAMTKLLRRCCPPTIEKRFVTTSSRRWHQNGIVRTVLQMWYLRWLYFIGVEPERLARRYYPDR